MRKKRSKAMARMARGRWRPLKQRTAGSSARRRDPSPYMSLQWRTARERVARFKNVMVKSTVSALRVRAACQGAVDRQEERTGMPENPLILPEPKGEAHHPDTVRAITVTVATVATKKMETTKRRVEEVVTAHPGWTKSMSMVSSARIR